MTEIITGEIVHAPIVKRPMMLAPQATVAEIKARVNFINTLLREIMVEGVDYGANPGTDDKKKVLKKPGAEKLCTSFVLTPIFKVSEQELDWDGVRHGGEPFFYYRMICELYFGDTLIASSMGSCNSREKKYRYRNSERVCPNCEVPAIKRSKFPPRNNPNGQPGWYCHDRAGGCGAQFNHNDPDITQQEVGKVANPDLADLENTILKMAEKRALVGSTLLAVNASDIFTQDLDDLETVDIHWKPASAQQTTVVVETPTAAVPELEGMQPGTWERLNTLAVKRFGDEWQDEARRKKFAAFVSNNQTSDIMTLLESEALAAIDGLEKKLAEMKAAAEATPVPA